MREEIKRQLTWLLDGEDPALRYQIERDLLGTSEDTLVMLQRSIPFGGWAKVLLGQQKADGSWGRDAYGPKWTCTHYVAYELLQLGFPSDHPDLHRAVSTLLQYPDGSDGGVNYAKTVPCSDVAINGTLLAITSCTNRDSVRSSMMCDFLLKTQLSDGGWNSAFREDESCSSLHTTIAVLEGLLRYRHAFSDEENHGTCEQAIERGITFLLDHRMVESHPTKERIKDDFAQFCFPVRYKYDVMRALDLFREFSIPYDARMDDALVLLESKARRNGRWALKSQVGATYGKIEENPSESRWNTLRALRILDRYRAS